MRVVLAVVLCLTATLAGILAFSPARALGAGAVTRVQQTDTRLAFTGTWGTGSNSGASGSSWGYTNTSGSLVTVKFTGTSLGWITVKSPNYGIAQVTVDGGAPVTVDLYSPDTKWQQKVWSATGLPDSAHTVTIAYTGTKNPSAAAAYIGADAFDVVGTLTQAGSPPPPPASNATRIEQTDTRLAPAGSWGTGGSSGASGGSWGYTNTSGSLVTVKFSGTSLSWITVKSPSYGIAQVTVDGGTPTSVDLYSPDTKWQQKVWSATGLANSAHTVTIAYSGKKNPAATGAYIGVDAFDVVGTLTQTAPPTPSTTTGKTYYVDATGGNDGNNGLAPGSAWKTLSKITSFAWSTGFRAGDTILFKRGEVWREPFALDTDSGKTKSGAAGAPITFDAYGTGAKPVWSGSADLSATGKWTNQGSNKWRTSGLAYEIGNILLNGEASNGNKKSALSGITTQGDFYYDATNDYLYMYSTSNPGSFYSHIEACQKFGAGSAPSSYIWGVHSYVTIRNVAIRNYAYHGLVFGNGSSHITIENCDFSWLGGGYDGLGTNTSDGNGIMIWNSASYVTIRNCTFRDIWETAVSLQATGVARSVNHIYIYGNTITRCNAAFDYWLKTDSASSASELYWVKNTIYNVGGGFFNRSGRQDSYPVGFSMAPYSPPTEAHILNNIFQTCASAYKDGAYLAPQATTSRTGWNIDYNCYYVDKAAAFKIGGTPYTFAGWKSATGKDAHSRAVDPLMLNPAAGDFHLQSTSPCIGAGMVVSGMTSASAVNIGAY